MHKHAKIIDKKIKEKRGKKVQVESKHRIEKKGRNAVLQQIKNDYTAKLKNCNREKQRVFPQDQ